MNGGPASPLPVLLARVSLAVRMTFAYKGRFPRWKVWALYWRLADDMVRGTRP